jgi:RNA recognition motif-containing protein
MPPKRARGADPAEDAPMEDAPARAVASDGDDDDDSDSDDSDDMSASSDSDAELDMPDESTMDRIMKLEQLVAATPTRYNVHVALIRELRGAKLRERARRAREAFAGSFALNENQWREWIADETAETRGKKKTHMREVVGPLFERAVTDVPGSVTLWQRYLEFGMDQDWESERRRALYERALNNAGADFRDGAKLFAARRAFESSRHAVDGDDKEKVATRMRQLFRRQLAIPHAGILETAGLAETWEAETKAEAGKETEMASEPVLNPAARAAHAVAVAVSERRRPLEEAVAAAEALPDGDADADAAVSGEADEKRRRRRRAAREARGSALAAAHRACVSAAESEFETDSSRSASGSGMHADVKLATLASAYERALAASPTDEALWRRYTSRLERSATGRDAADAHARALRHCPFSGETFACALRWRCARGDLEGARAMLESVRARFGVAPREAHAALAAAARSGAVSAEEALARLGVSFGEDGVRGDVVLSWPDPVLWLDPELTLLRQSVRCLTNLDARKRLWDKFAESSTVKNVAEVHVARALFLADALGDDDAAAAAFKKAFAKIDTLVSASSSSKSGAVYPPPLVLRSKPQARWCCAARGWRSRGAGAPAPRRTPKKPRVRFWKPTRARAFGCAPPRRRARRAPRRRRTPRRPSACAGPTTPTTWRRPARREWRARDRRTPPRTRGRDPDPDPPRRSREEARRIPTVFRYARRNRKMTIAESIPRRLVCLGTPRLARRSTRSSSPIATRGRRSCGTCPSSVPSASSRRSSRTPATKKPATRTEKEPGASSGRVTARVVMDKATGKPRGFAYVEFASEKALRAAVMRDGEAFKGRKLSIAVSLPPGKDTPGGGAKAQKIQKPDPGPGRRAPRGLGFGGGMTPRAARPAVAAGGGTPSDRNPTRTSARSC